MSSNNRSVIHSGAQLLPAHGDSSLSLKKASSAAAWLPLLLLAALIHALCRTPTKRLLLAIVLLDIPLQWGVHLDFLPKLSNLGAIGGYDVSITTIALFSLYVGWLFSVSTSSQHLRPLWNWPIALYTATVLFSILSASDTQLALFYSFILVQMLFLYIYLSANIQSRSDILFVVTLILVGGLLESLYIIAIAVFGGHFGLTPVDPGKPIAFSALGLKTLVFLPVKDVPFVREGGTIGSPNYAAGYLAILITLAFCVRQMKVPAYLRRLTVPTIIAAAIALVLTFSRGGWGGAALSIAIVIAAKWQRTGISAKKLLAGLTIVLVIVFGLCAKNPVSERLFSADNGSAESRVPLMHLAYHMIEAHPVMGVGANNFAAVMSNYTPPEFRHAWLYTVHNQFLLVCAETGVIGLAAYLWVYFSILRRGWALWKRRDELFSPLGLAIVAGVCGLMFHMLVDIFSERALLQLIWIFMALVGACEVISQQDSAQHLIERPIEATL